MESASASLFTYLVQLCIKSFVHFWYFVWAYQMTCMYVCTCNGIWRVQVPVYSHISCNYESSHLCISGTLCGHIKGVTCFFFLLVKIYAHVSMLYLASYRTVVVWKVHTTVLWLGQVERTTPHSFHVGRRGVVFRVIGVIWCSCSDVRHISCCLSLHCWRPETV